ncbi:glycosylase [Gordonia phage Schmidt]|uniref:Glycosylase n=1 Tax=Gordonia phage Schmidt TaxID=2301697 RepID=A0A385E2R2_9CAUD|nr:glycosylase [Gordonia phage Schmidt]AXQ65198.1 glycosylase [Gordonia phage Schmidt]
MTLEQNAGSQMPARAENSRSERRLVVVESPFAGDQTRNVEYAQDAMRDSLARGEAPLASHLLYTQVLDDREPEQRRQGIAAGLAWNKHADLIAVYTDRGITQGMQDGIVFASLHGVPVEYRSLEEWRRGGIE